MKSGEKGPALKYAGPTLYERIWMRMDEATAKIMEGDRSDKTVGKAIGISIVLAEFVNPYEPSPKKIREEAKRRWQEKNGEAGR